MFNSEFTELTTVRKHTKQRKNNTSDPIISMRNTSNLLAQRKKKLQESVKELPLLYETVQFVRKDRTGKAIEVWPGRRTASVKYITAIRLLVRKNVPSITKSHSCHHTSFAFRQNY